MGPGAGLLPLDVDDNTKYPMIPPTISATTTAAIVNVSSIVKVIAVKKRSEVSDTQTATAQARIHTCKHLTTLSAKAMHTSEFHAGVDARNATWQEECKWLAITWVGIISAGIERLPTIMKMEI